MRGDRNTCRTRGAAVLGRNGKYQIDNKTADYIWNQSILPLSYGTVQTYYITDDFGNILTDDNGNRLIWKIN